MDEAARQPRRMFWTAWSVWIATSLLMGLVILLDTHERSVVPTYRTAVENWIAGKPLYNMGGSGFIYAPQAALVFVPWGLLPKPVGEIAWTWTILGVLAAGVFRFTRLASCDARWFLINSLASVAMAAGCARNGQSTLIITGLMLLAAVDLAEQRWWRATILLTLAFAFKPVAIVLILLTAAIYPKMLWRLVIGMMVIALAPFLTQYPDYVSSQFVACYQNSKIAFASGETGYWAQLFGMLKVAGLDLPSPVQQSARLIAAVATLFGSWLAVRRLALPRGTFYLYAMSICYLMLFNSRTEGSTYAMIGPVYGLLLADAWLLRRHKIETVLFLGAIVATVFNYDLAKLLTPPPREVWVGPLVCVIVTVYLVLCMAREIRNATLK